MRFLADQRKAGTLEDRGLAGIFGQHLPAAGRIAQIGIGLYERTHRAPLYTTLSAAFKAASERP